MSRREERRRLVISKILNRLLRRHEMSRIPLNHKPTLLLRIAEIYSKRRYGAVLEPGLALLHNRKVLTAMIAHENRVARWDALDPTVKAVAVLAAAAEIGCDWCLDFGFWESVNRGIEPVKLREITNWQQSTVYSERERTAISYAVAMTQTPPEVTDDMVAELRRRFSDAEVVELTAMIALENQRSRTNTALGLKSQGFRNHCGLTESSVANRPLSASSDVSTKVGLKPVPFDKLCAHDQLKRTDYGS
jgi:alkylhydroperoxidase family enzyme